MFIFTCETFLFDKFSNLLELSVTYICICIKMDMGKNNKFIIILLVGDDAEELFGACM